MKRWSSLLSIFLFTIISSTCILYVPTQAQFNHKIVASETHETDNPHGGHTSDRWEGSPEGKAFSEFAHHVAGSFDVIFGLAELGSALRYPLPSWVRFILPGALTIVGGFTLIWSDRDAWPTGSLSFVETFFGEDHQIIQHKSYALLALAIAFFETLRRTGKVRHPAWSTPLVLLVLVSALSLFGHSHGNQPEAAKIHFYHSLMGIVGVGAAFSKGLASWLPGASPQTRRWWEVAWSGSVILFGVLLLAYSE